MTSSDIPVEKAPELEVGRGGWKADILPALLLLAMVLASFYPLFQAQFINLDDNVYVYENERVKAGLTPGNIRWAFTTTYFGYYYPMTWLSHMLDCQLFGLWAGGHHINSVLLHIINSILLFVALKMMTGFRWRSFFAAALFAVHPLHVESVAWIAERKDLLSTLFFFLMMVAYARYVIKPGYARYIPVFAALLLSLAAKPMLVTAPFLLLLLDIWPMRRWDPWRNGNWDWELPTIRRLALEKVPLLCLSAIFSAVTYWAQKSLGAMADMTQLALWKRVMNALYSYLLYIIKMFFPADLTIFYPHPRGPIPFWKWSLGLAFIAVMSFLAIYLLRRRPHLCTGWFWYLGALVPVIGLVQIGLQAMADRYTYISLIGIFILLSWEAALLAGRLKLKWAVAGVLAACILLPLAAASNVQCRTWKDNFTVFSRCLEVSPVDNFVAHSGLGIAYLDAGDSDKALFHLKRGLALQADEVATLIKLGTVLAERKNFAEAEKCFTRAIKLNPTDFVIYLNLGIVATEEGKWAKAADFFRKCIELNPDEPQAHNNLAWILLEKDPAGWANGAEALKLAQRACELSKNQDPNFLDTLAEAKAAAGDSEGSLRTAASAAALARSMGQEDLAKDIEQRAASYGKR